jgi:hypothetical protein
MKRLRRVGRHHYERKGQTVAEQASLDELEPSNGKYDWERAFAQNPELPVFDVPNWERDRIYGVETAEDAQARAAAQDASEWLEIAHP